MSYRPEIFVAESRDFSPKAAEKLARVGLVRLEDCSFSELLAKAADAEYLWVRLRHFIGPKALRSMPRLRAVVTATTGLNHIDVAEATKRGIDILSLRGEANFLRDVRATAEHTVTLILALYRHLPAATRQAVEGPWDRDALRGSEIFGKTVGLIGYGRLGQIVACYMVAFGARVLANDIRPVVLDPDSRVELVSLDPLLAESDIVSLHASYETENRNFFDAGCFRRMKPSAVFINTARGELVDESALLAALNNGQIAGAAVDVLEDETAIDPARHPLIEYARRSSNLLITPHLAGSTKESLHKVEEHMADRLAEHIHKTGIGESPKTARHPQSNALLG